MQAPKAGHGPMHGKAKKPQAYPFNLCCLKRYDGEQDGRRCITQTSLHSKL